jgi:ribosomal protein S18 acetylase RimI-like enzyme
MTDKIRLREATPEDAEALAALAQETWTVAFGHTMKPDELKAFNARKFSPLKLGELLREDTFLVASRVDDPIGFVQFGKVNLKPEYFTAPAVLHANSGQVQKLYVLAAFQNAGVGARLLEAALEHPRFKNRSAIYLDVWPENHGAIRFYRRYGFTQKVGKIPFGNEYDDILARVR